MNMAQRDWRMVRTVFRREFAEFFGVKLLIVVYLVQPCLFILIMAGVLRQLGPLFDAQPGLAPALAVRLSTIYFLCVSLLLVSANVQRGIQEKATGLIDTLLTTPLSVRQLVLGKALHLSALGCALGAALTAANVAMLARIAGTGPALGAFDRPLAAASIVAVPFLVFVVHCATVSLALIARDARIAGTLYMFAGIGGFFLSNSKSLDTSIYPGMLAATAACLAIYGVFHVGIDRVSKETILRR